MTSARKKKISATHASVEEVKKAVRFKGGDLACPLCGREEFAYAEVAIPGAGALQRYGVRRLRRVQMICENCGGVVSLDLSRLEAGRPT